jgi:hypothetical protein
VLDAVDRDVEIPGRGRMSIRQVRGPEGAPTLVLLHGLAATGRLNWFTALPALAERYHVLVVDHRGHGRGIRTRHFRLADCADDVIALADVLAIESLVAVGYSMGGPHRQAVLESPSGSRPRAGAVRDGETLPAAAGAGRRQRGVSGHGRGGPTRPRAVP